MAVSQIWTVGSYERDKWDSWWGHLSDIMHPFSQHFELLFSGRKDIHKGQKTITLKMVDQGRSELLCSFDHEPLRT